MSNGIRSLPRYQHGGPHPEPPFDAEAFREAVRQGWTVNPLPTAAEQAEEGIRSMVELAADNEPVWESMERFWASQGEPPLEFPPAPRQESVEDQIKRLLSPDYVDPPVRGRTSRLAHRAGRAARNVGIAGLKAIRNRLPSVIGAGLATAAASHPASAAVDIALSPTPMGSGDMPKRDLLTDEQKIRYYQDRLNLQRELGVGQHYPSFFQPSRERSGPSIRPSYPMGR